MNFKINVIDPTRLHWFLVIYDKVSPIPWKLKKKLYFITLKEKKKHVLPVETTQFKNEKCSVTCAGTSCSRRAKKRCEIPTKLCMMPRNKVTSPRLRPVSKKWKSREGLEVLIGASSRCARAEMKSARRTLEAAAAGASWTTYIQGHQINLRDCQLISGWGKKAKKLLNKSVFNYWTFSLIFDFWWDIGWAEHLLKPKVLGKNLLFVEAVKWKRKR